MSIDPSGTCPISTCRTPSMRSSRPGSMRWGPAERSLLQDAAILGQTFTVASLAAVTGDTDPDLEPRLRDLVRRDVLIQNRDPRSPERGQYGFVQALIREVAYGTMARRDRRDPSSRGGALLRVPG